MAGNVFTVDASEADALQGLLSGMSQEIKTARYMSSVLNYSHGIMSNEFDLFMASISPTQPERFHHVYEWNQIGQPKAQLWKNLIVGHGGSKIATFKWLASKTTVPIPEQLKETGDGPKRIHVFVWKAPIMEFSIPVTIRPQRGNILIIPFGDTFRFTQQWQHVANPGGEATHGAFTTAYEEWWAGGAGEKAFQTSIKSTLENDLGRTPVEQAVRPFRRARSKQVTLSTFNSRAFEYGRAKAEQYIQGLESRYLAQAAAREANFGNDG